MSHKKTYENTEICRICLKVFREVRGPHLKTHGITEKQYERKYFTDEEKKQRKEYWKNYKKQEEKKSTDVEQIANALGNILQNKGI